MPGAKKAGRAGVWGLKEAPSRLIWAAADWLDGREWGSRSEVIVAPFLWLAVFMDAVSSVR